MAAPGADIFERDGDGMGIDQMQCHLQEVVGETGEALHMPQ